MFKVIRLKLDLEHYIEMRHVHILFVIIILFLHIKKKLQIYLFDPLQIIIFVELDPALEKEKEPLLLLNKGM